jgi:hypothetical protein
MGLGMGSEIRENLFQIPDSGVKRHRIRNTKKFTFHRYLVNTLGEIRDGFGGAGPVAVARPPSVLLQQPVRTRVHLPHPAGRRTLQLITRPLAAPVVIAAHAAAAATVERAAAAEETAATAAAPAASRHPGSTADHVLKLGPNKKFFWAFFLGLPKTR